MAQQLSDQSLREMAQRIQALLSKGFLERIRDRGRKLLATLDAIHREQDRRQARSDGGEAGCGDEEEAEAERAEAEVMAQQLSDQSLRKKAQRIQSLLTGGIFEYHPDRGRKLLAILGAFHREQDRRQARGDGGEAGSGGEEKEEAVIAQQQQQQQQLSDQSLQEKAQRIQALLTKGISQRLPDRGRKLRAILDAILREQDRRGARTPGNEACDASNSNGHNRSVVRNGSGHSPQGTQSPNMWGYSQQGRYIRGYLQQAGFPNSIGREAAKAQHKGKRKMDEVKDGISMVGDNINMIAEITQEHKKKDREMVTEAQLEISRNQLKTAMEQKEAKLLEAYTLLLVQDTSQMAQEAKATRDQALASLTHKLFGKASTVT